MITEFLEGETYTNPNGPQDILVVGINKETKTSVTLAVLWIDRDSYESVGGGELKVNKDDLVHWTVVEL